MKKNNVLSYIAVLSIFFFAGAGTFMNPAIATFQQAFPDIALSTIMLVVTLPALISMPVMLLVGSIVGKHIGYKFTAVLGTILIIVGGAMPFLIPMGWSTILVFRAVLGAGVGLYGIRNPLLLKVVPEEKHTAFIGYGSVLFTGGAAVLQPFVGILAQKGWRNAFAIDLIPVVILLLVLFFLPEIKNDADAADTENTKGKEKLSGKVYLYVVLQFVATCALYPMLSGMSTFMDAYGIGSAALAGTALSVYSLSGAAGDMILTQIQKLFGKYTITAMAVLVIIGQALMLFIPSVVTCFIGVILAGCGFMVIFAMLQVYNGKVCSSSTVALGSSMILAGNQLSIFVSSYFISGCEMIFKMKGSSVDSAFLGCIVVYALIALASVVLKLAPEK